MRQGDVFWVDFGPAMRLADEPGNLALHQGTASLPKPNHEPDSLEDSLDGAGRQAPDALLKLALVDGEDLRDVHHASRVMLFGRRGECGPFPAFAPWGDG